MKQLVMLRHGESEWNVANRFTGWVDVDLSKKGKEEAKEAGRLLKEAGLVFDVAYTSLLRRAIKTLHYALDELESLYLPVFKHWRLNERHYGGLQGLNKSETAKKYGEDQVKQWRRSYDIPPPQIDEHNEYYPTNDIRYRDFDDLNSTNMPKGESLKDTVERFTPYWQQTIKASLLADKTPLVTAHGNSLRAFVMLLSQFTADEIIEINIPTGMPLVYELTDQLEVKRYYYLGDEAKVKQAMAQIASQGK